MIVTLDFETFSPCDLTVSGAWRYSEDPETEVLSLVYHVDGAYYLLKNNVEILYNLAADPIVSFRSHGDFEQAIWANIMVPQFLFSPIAIERWIDTMASCALHGVPLNLDAALRALKLRVTKDQEGKRLVIGLSKANKKTGLYPDITPEILEKVYEYNRIDVEGTCALGDCLGRLPSDEQRIWEIDQKINQRGIQLDMSFVRSAQFLIARETVPLMREFRELTGVNHSQRDKVLTWLKDQGVDLKDYTKFTIDKALDDDADQRAGNGTSNPLPENARRALSIRQIVSSASIKKLTRMERGVCADGRARGLLQYHGSTTGRWAGRGVQPQNLPRPRFRADPDVLVADIIRGDPEQIKKVYGVDPIGAVASALRHAFVARDGCVLVSADYAGIEARIVLALARQHDKVTMLAQGKDVYSDMASVIFGRPVTKDDMDLRQVGKNTVLGCGFGLGWEKFASKYLGHLADRGPDYVEVLARRIINSYRYRWAPRIPELWRDLEFTAYRAMHNPGQWYTANCKIMYGWVNNYMVCRLFDGKCLYYYSPEIINSPKDWDQDHKTWRYRTRGQSTGGPRGRNTYNNQESEHRETGKWVWAEAYGGLLTENVVQALARQLLCRALERFDSLDMPVVLTVHDEIVLELPDDRDWTKCVSDVMCKPVDWAEDLCVPVAVEAWQGKRYRK